jgi:hypothetical protein
MNQFNQSNWVWFLILFMFGSSFFSAISFALISLFSLPSGWVWPLTLVMLGLTALLIYHQYSYKAYLLGACLIFSLISLAALVNSLLTPKPDIPSNFRPYIEESATTGFSVMGLELVDIPPGSDYDFDANQKRGLYATGPFFYDYGYSDYGLEPLRQAYRFRFSPIQSPGGQWAFESGTARLTGGLSGRYTAEPDSNHPSLAEFDFEEGQAPAPAFPFVVFQFPMGNSVPDEEIQVTVELTYRVPNQEAPQTLRRELTILHAGERFFFYDEQYRSWLGVKRVLELPFLLGLILANLASLGGAYYFYQNGALERVGFGNLILVVRKPGGLKSLGVEAHNLAKVQVQGAQNEGVMLGLVMAQSPAGRGGLRAGDVVLNFDGKNIKTPRDLSRAAGRMKKGQTATMNVLREGEPLELNIRF